MDTSATTVSKIQAKLHRTCSWFEVTFVAIQLRVKSCYIHIYVGQNLRNKLSRHAVKYDRLSMLMLLKVGEQSQALQHTLYHGKYCLRIYCTYNICMQYVCQK